MPVNRTLMKAISFNHAFWYQLTGGLMGGSFLGRPILLLTTTGRKTGRLHTTPLVFVSDGDDMVLAASNAGNTRHPDWWLNLQANPEAEVHVRHQRKRVTAALAKGRERDRLWGRLVEMYRGYQDYQMTADREIPVVVLRPLAPEAADATRAAKTIRRASQPRAARKTAAHSRNTRQTSRLVLAVNPTAAL
jgi:deazaflavin-dependent oxidoreductase (nitroreductase family)